MVCPIILLGIDIVVKAFDSHLVGSFRRAIGFRVAGHRHTEVDLELLEQFLPEVADEGLVAVRGNRRQKAETLVPGCVEKGGNIGHGGCCDSGLDENIVHKAVHHHNDGVISI